MAASWPTTKLRTVGHAIEVLTDLRGKRWSCRGQAKQYRSLYPSIDRRPRDHLTRPEKLAFERQSIDLFQSTARFFADEGERNIASDDLGALMLLRHYGVPTRLLDWSHSPFVASYFAAEADYDQDGELWAFDDDRYVREGTKQWKKWKKTTRGGTGKGKDFDARRTMFTLHEPPDWFVCQFYPTGFPRQNAQSGFYSLTARFGVDHARAIARLLIGSRYYHRYIVPAALKAELRKLLRDQHGIWRGSLFPDTAGAAETVKWALHTEPTLFRPARRGSK
jgi:hypothetical protein